MTVKLSMKNHIKIWNDWRKYNLNSKVYQILVLLKLAISPSFEFKKACNYMRRRKNT